MFNQMDFSESFYNRLSFLYKAYNQCNLEHLLIMAQYHNWVCPVPYLIPRFHSVDLDCHCIYLLTALQMSFKSDPILDGLCRSLSEPFGS